MFIFINTSHFLLLFLHISICSCSLHASHARPRGCRGPAPRLVQPFPQLGRAAGFTGFTLTPLTPRPRPPTATHPASDQSHRGHVLITHRLACDWPRPATPLPAIGCVLPPARLLWILFLCFFFFFFFLAPLSWSQSAGRGLALIIDCSHSRYSLCFSFNICRTFFYIFLI